VNLWPYPGVSGYSPLFLDGSRSQAAHRFPPLDPFAMPGPHPAIRSASASLLCALTLLLGVEGARAQLPVPPPPGDSLALRSAMEEFVQIRDSGGWPEVPAGATLRLGDRDPRVVILRDRLRISGDLNPAPDAAPRGVTTSLFEPTLFDEALDRAVRRFQGRHALEVDGAVGAATRAALNVPVQDRIRQISLNLDRRRDFRPAPASGPFRVIVNIPGFEAFVLEEGGEPRIHRVITGRVDRPTPELTGRIEHVVLSPFWNVPPGILTLDKLPEIRRDPSYIARSRMSVIDRSTSATVNPNLINWSEISASEFNSRYWLRQAPGPSNALGLVKFIFPNPYHVFLHDTPDRHLFERERRAFSSGCMRLDGAMELAERLLIRVPGWGLERIHEVANRGTEVWVALAEPVPIQTVYWTTWVTPDGTLHMVDDLYGLDRGRPVSNMTDEVSECAEV